MTETVAHQIITATIGDTLASPDILPDFSCTIAEIFE
jgi:hypothetical protein